MDFEGLELSDELKAQIEERVSAETTGLIKKRDELLGKQVKTKADFRALQEQTNGIFDKLGIKSYDELDDALSAQNGNADAGKKTEIELKRYQRELESAQNDKNAVFNQLSSTVIDGQIKSELLKAGVKSEMVDALSLQFKTKDKFQLVKDDNGNYSPVNSLGLSPIEAVSEWVKTDESKVWRSAPANIGGGSQGANGGGVKSYKGMSLTEIEGLTDRNEIIKAMKENGFMK